MIRLRIGNIGELVIIIISGSGSGNSSDSSSSSGRSSGSGSGSCCSIITINPTEICTVPTIQ